MSADVIQFVFRKSPNGRPPWHDVHCRRADRSKYRHVGKKIRFKNASTTDARPNGTGDRKVVINFILFEIKKLRICSVVSNSNIDKCDKTKLKSRGYSDNGVLQCARVPGVKLLKVGIYIFLKSLKEQQMTYKIVFTPYPCAFFIYLNQTNLMRRFSIMDYVINYFQEDWMDMKRFIILLK